MQSYSSCKEPQPNQSKREQPYQVDDYGQEHNTANNDWK